MTPIEIRFAGYQPSTSVHSRAAVVFRDALQQRLGACLRMTITDNIVAAGHPAAQLLTMLEDGTMTVGYFSASYLAARVAEFALLDVPFTLTDRVTAHAVLDGPLGQFLIDRLHAASGWQVLGFWDNGFRHLSNAVRPLHTPQDCQGLRLRTLLSPVHERLFRLLGFTPIALDVKELLPAIQAGRIDAQENPLTTFYHFGIHQYHHYITLTGHLFGAALLLCHRATYARWPAEVRQAVCEAAQTATAAQRRFAAAEDREVLTHLALPAYEIVHLTAAERAAFVQAAAPLLVEQKSTFAEQLWGYLTRPG